MKNGMIGGMLEKCGIDLNELNRYVRDDFLSNDIFIPQNLNTKIT